MIQIYSSIRSVTVFNETHDDEGDGGDQDDVESEVGDEDDDEGVGGDQEGQTKDQLVSNRLLTDWRWVCLF